MQRVTISFRVPEAEYRALGYEPDYDSLPWKESYVSLHLLGGQIECDLNRVTCLETQHRCSDVAISAAQMTGCYRTPTSGAG
jgi:hypothetical protein